jgi:hypothetical protein
MDSSKKRHADSHHYAAQNLATRRLGIDDPSRRHGGHHPRHTDLIQVLVDAHFDEHCTMHVAGFLVFRDHPGYAGGCRLFRLDRVETRRPNSLDQTDALRSARSRAQNPVLVGSGEP